MSRGPENLSRSPFENAKSLLKRNKEKIALVVGMTLVAMPSISCADSERKTTTVSPSVEIQQEQNYRILKIQEDLYYVGPVIFGRSYYGEDLAIGLNKLGEQFHIISQQPIFGTINRSGTITEGFLVTVGPKQTPKP